MKHLKVFENFSAESQINEAKETPLAGGFINANIDDSNSDQGFTPKNGVIYFQTNTTTPDKNMGSPGNLDISVTNGKTSTSLEFSNNNFIDEDRVISWKFRDFAAMKGGTQAGMKDSVLAKNPAEAKAKAYEILLHATYLTPTPGEPKVVGDFLRSFFEIRKMYPEYLTKNDLLKGFMQGILDQYYKPNFGRWANYDDFQGKEKAYTEEIGKVLREVGAIKSAN